MNLAKPSGDGRRDAPIEDPAHIRKAMAALLQTEAEFPIKVEGTHTLPYTSRIERMEGGRGMLYLKLIRPLPHEMATGASFEMLFAVGDQRFEAPITFLGRESYLLYQFSIPIRMVQADRRDHKRYPFRPREKAYVLAQDAGLPGYGLAGPLVNLSLGGLAFRVDRIVRLADRMRVTPGVGFFDKGKELPMLKIRDLPKHPLFEARGTVANAWERDGEIVVGVSFGELGDAEFRQVEEVLAIREQMQRNPVASATEGPAKAARAKPRAVAAVASADPGRRINPAGTQTPEALAQLGRRCTCLMLVMAPGPSRDAVQAALGAAGYLRLDPVDTVDQAFDKLRGDTCAASRLLVLESPQGLALPLAGLRGLQRELGELKELPVALIRPGGLPEETGDPLIRPLPWPGTAGGAWLAGLDELAGL